MRLQSTENQTITSGAKTTISSVNVAIQTSGSGGKLELKGGAGIQINGPISVSDSYSGSRKDAVSRTYKVRGGDLLSKDVTLKFINGILIEGSSASNN